MGWCSLVQARCKLDADDHHQTITGDSGTKLIAMARNYVPISPAQLHHETGVDDWEYIDTALVANFHLPTFAAAGEFASAITALADAVDHHPDIDIRYPGLITIHASTHVTKGVSDADVELARAISNLYKSGSY